MINLLIGLQSFIYQRIQLQLQIFEMFTLKSQGKI